MKAIVYRLHLLEPMLVAQAGAGEENSAVSLPYIPGSALRGALAARWLAEHPVADLATDPTGRALFLDGTVCHLNAYPEYDGERTLLKPASWMTEKDLADDPNAPIFDLAIADRPNLKAPKSPAGLFCRLERVEPEEAWLPVEYRAVLVKPSRYEQVHITLEDVNRRGEGNLVFRYDALAPGQVFSGAIVAPDGYDLAELKRLLGAGDLMLGTAHLAGYGRVAVESVYEQENWTEYPRHGATANGRWVVALLSPTIVRDAGGQIGWDGGLALALSLGFPKETKPLAAFGRTELMGGYNRKWSLPLPQAWALAAGCVFVFDAQVTDPALLQAAVARGIGERRAEGFGRIAINWQAAAQISQDEAKQIEITPPALAAESRQQAREMAQRRLRQMLDRELARRVNAEADRMRNPPANAQLSAIRQAALAGLTRRGNMQPLIDHLGNLRAAGKAQLESCRLGNQSLFEWLCDRARELDVQKQLLGDRPLPRMAGETAPLSDDLKVEYTARLIDGVMQLTARRNRKVKR